MVKVIKTTWFPFGEYDAIVLWPFVFVKGEVKQHVITHERIHLHQQAELPIGFFFLLYALFYVIAFLRLLFKEKKSVKEAWERAYNEIPFEREAYAKEFDPSYPTERKHYSWIKYLKNN